MLFLINEKIIRIQSLACHFTTAYFFQVLLIFHLDDFNVILLSYCTVNHPDLLSEFVYMFIASNE